MSIIADTSFVVAVALSTDQDHAACTSVYLQQQSKIYLPQSTLAEVAYLITREGGNLALARFLQRLPETKYRVEPLEAEDFLRCAQILERHADTRVDFVDASIVAVAERIKATRILTLDRRDFSIIHPAHAPHFEILPQTNG